jgi:hypothetical protein
MRPTKLDANKRLLLIVTFLSIVTSSLTIYNFFGLSPREKAVRAAEDKARIRQQRLEAYTQLHTLGIFDETIVSNKIQKDWDSAHTIYAGAITRVCLLGPDNVSEAATRIQAFLQPPELVGDRRSQFYAAKETLNAAMTTAIQE